MEDVAVFQSVDATRRRDLQQALTANMSDIFDFLLELLRMQVTFYNERKSTGAPEAVFNSRLAQSVIAVFQAHVEWVSINHIMAHDGQLLVLLCNLLSEENFRLPSADCLLQVTFVNFQTEVANDCEYFVSLDCESQGLSQRTSSVTHSFYPGSYRIDAQSS